jgi:hypothetical protein
MYNTLLDPKVRMGSSSGYDPGWYQYLELI